ncbi:C40 family peptidase [Croceimicrobium sp.]|uniref:C40 family peptidase n=1 Tax=Croceimicrobium sp. TaxID=2828340 RepID=UPI003BA9A0D1
MIWRYSKYLLALSLVLLLSSCGSLKRSPAKPKAKSGPQFEHEILNSKKDRSTKAKNKTEDKEENEAKESAVDVKVSDLESFIDDWYGTPHRMGGMTKKGVDCSGFVIIAYQEVFNREFQGRRAEDIFSEMKAVDQDELQFGDLVFFKVRGRRIDHVGIYLGDDQFAHTSSSRGVMISSLTNVYWSKRFFKGGRYQG